MPTPCETLATKAELQATINEVQELRDQLNAVLGEKEGGGTQVLFAPGNTPTIVTAGAGLTLLGLAKTNAPSVITDIALETPGNKAIWQELSEGTAKLTSFKGNGSKKALTALDKVSKTAGQGVKAGKASAKIGSSSAGGIGALADLTTIGATLYLNKMTVDILDERVEAEARGAQVAIDQVNASSLRLWEKHQGDITKINAEIENNNIIAKNQAVSLEVARSDIQTLNNQTTELNSRVTEIQGTVTTLQTDLDEAYDAIQELDNDLIETKTILTASYNEVRTGLSKAIEIIEQQKITIEKQAEHIAQLEEKITTLETRVTELEATQQILIDKYTELDRELTQFFLDNPEFIKKAEAEPTHYTHVIKFITEENYRKAYPQTSGGVQGSATAQKQNLELAQKLAEPDADKLQVTTEDILNDPQTWRDKFEDYLEKIKPGKEVTPEQIEEIKTGTAIKVAALVGTSVIPRLDNLTNAVSESKISDAVQTGLCKSLNGGSCPATSGNPNPTQGLKGLESKLNEILGGANLLQGQNIAGMVSRIDKTVHHSTYGIQKGFEFAETAWKATRADKIMNGINTMLLIHNGMMLSNNIGQTMGYALSQGLSVIGIKDNSTGEALDINRLVANKIQSVLKGALGKTTYANLTAKLRAANRVYQTGANVLSNVRSIIDASQDIAETTGENVAVIGNALRHAGAVRENAYSYMPENLNNTSRVLNRLNKLSDAASAIEDVTSEAVDIKDEIKEMKESQKEFSDARTKLTSELKKEETTQKTAITKALDPTEIDEDRAKSKDQTSE